ncbi:MAG: hypothetical protein ABI781_05375, partial [Burkholderiales bacterium]
MLTINPSSLRATLGDAAANAATGGSPSGSSADPAGFASLLRQTQVVSAPSPTFTPAPAPAPAAATDKEPANEPAPANEASDDAPAPQESDATRRTHPVLKGKLRGTDGATVAPRDAKPTADTGDSKRPEAADKTAAGDCKAPETKLTSTEAPIDPNVMQWLAGLQRAAAGQTEAAQAGVDGKTVPADTDTGVIEARGAAKGSLAADLKAEADLKDKAAQGTAQLTDAAGTNPFAAALTEQGGIVEKPQVKMFDGVKDAGPTGAAGVAPPPTGGSTVAAPAAVAIATPVTAPDFAQELGLRLSTLAKDGVQTAELHLNPADMGPVSVQIVMDGTQA